MSNQPPAGPPEGWKPRPQGQGQGPPPPGPPTGGWGPQPPQGQGGQQPPPGWGPGPVSPPKRPAGSSNRRLWLGIVGVVLGLLVGPFLGVFIGAVLTGNGLTAAWRVAGVVVCPILFAWLFARRRKDKRA